MKFGGSSVGSVESVQKVKAIIESTAEPVVVVVSALGGVTDQLIHISKLASQGHTGYEKELFQLQKRHLTMAETVIADSEKRNALLQQLHTLLNELENIFKGVFLIRDLSQKTSDLIVSYGERLSSLIVSALLNNAQLFDARRFIKTEKQFQKHIVDFQLTNRLIEKEFIFCVIFSFTSNQKHLCKFS